MISFLFMGPIMALLFEKLTAEKEDRFAIHFTFSIVGAFSGEFLFRHDGIVDSITAVSVFSSAIGAVIFLTILEILRRLKLL